jgi:hypothetical protein
MKPQDPGIGDRSSPLAPRISRAVHSNRERLRRRLEGDGWEFVGGRYADVVEEEESRASSTVDEEFDVVVLGVVSVA